MISGLRCRWLLILVSVLPLLSQRWRCGGLSYSFPTPGLAANARTTGSDQIRSNIVLPSLASKFRKFVGGEVAGREPAISNPNAGMLTTSPAGPPHKYTSPKKKNEDVREVTSGHSSFFFGPLHQDLKEKKKKMRTTNNQMFLTVPKCVEQFLNVALPICI